MWLVLAAAWNLSISAEEGKNKKKNQTSEYFEGKNIRDAAEVISIVASPLPSTPPSPPPLCSVCHCSEEFLRFVQLMTVGEGCLRTAAEQ